jgi:hypothetical protein
MLAKNSSTPVPGRPDLWHLVQEANSGIQDSTDKVGLALISLDFKILMRAHCVRSHIGKGIRIQHLPIIDLKGVDKNTLEALKKAGVTATIRRGSLYTPAMRNRHSMTYTRIENKESVQ